MLQSWINNHTLTSQNYTALVTHFETFVNTTYDADKAADIRSKMNWTEWVRMPGLPPNTSDFVTENLTLAQKIASDYIKDHSKSPADYDKYKTWYSSLHVVFLEQLITEYGSMTTDIMKKIDDDLNITSTSDPEVKQRWYPLGLKLNYTIIEPIAKEFVQNIGRWKYVKPIY